MADADMQPRVLPHDVQAEMGVLGSMLLSPEAVFLARERLDVSSFYKLAHQDIFDAMGHLADSHDTIDLILLRDELKRRDKLENVGGVAYLTELMEAVPTSANVEYYIEIVRDNAIRRELMAVAEGILKSARQLGRDADEVLDEAEQKMLAVRHTNEATRVHDMNSVLLDLMPRWEQLHQSPNDCTGLPTGFHDLNLITSGFQPGDLIVVAARPSVGKTSLVLNFLDYLCINESERRPAVLYSLEMRAEQIVSNLLCIHNQIDTQDFRRGRLTEEQWDQLEESVQVFADAPLYLDDSATLSIGELRARARRMRHKSGVELIVVDYLQLVRPARSRDSRAAEVSEISAGLKALARELEIPVIAVAQLNRAVERDERLPRMSDLRESGAIEQDADVIMLLHRPDESKEGGAGAETWPQEGTDSLAPSPINVIVAKQRHGPTAVCPLVFMKRYLRFGSAATYRSV